MDNFKTNFQLILSQTEAILIAPRTLDKSEESSRSLYTITDRVTTWTKDSASLLERSNTSLCLITEEGSLGGQWASHTRASRACNAHLLCTATVPVTPSHTTTHRSTAWICMIVSGGSLEDAGKKRKTYPTLGQVVLPTADHGPSHQAHVCSASSAWSSGCRRTKEYSPSEASSLATSCLPLTCESHACPPCL